MMCYLGHKFIHLFISLIVGAATSFFTFFFAYYKFGLQSVDLQNELIAALCLSILIGICTAWKIYKRFHGNVLWILGAIIGLYIGRLLSLYMASVIRSKMEYSQQRLFMVEANDIFFCILGLAIGVTIEFSLRKHLTRAGTALIGAYFMVRGFSRYIGYFPQSFKLESTGDFDD